MKYVFLSTVFCLIQSVLLSQNDVLWCERTTLSKQIDIPTKIAFGSCGSQNKEQPILEEIVQKKPSLFIYLGDNIYGDTRDMRVLKEKYGMLSCKPEFQKLRKNMPVIATWDDHDYGVNDGGIEYPMKAESKKIFLEFWKEPATSERWKHDGIYHTEYFGDSAHQVQVILLDTRTFRTSLIGKDGVYQPNLDSSATILGKEQWEWLKAQLLKPAMLRIIASSTQFATQWNGWEAWANFPIEQQRMFSLIKSTRANGVVFISGDVHYAELSKQQSENAYPIFDMTSSGITQLEHHLAHNQYRIGEGLNKKNFGMIEIDWQTDPTIIFKGFNKFGKEKINHSVKLSELKFQ